MPFQVKECLKFAARLKLSNLSSEQRENRMQEVLEELGLCGTPLSYVKKTPK
jgi:hypothetical protein